jgi:hypothetical protein
MLHKCALRQQNRMQLQGTDYTHIIKEYSIVQCTFPKKKLLLKVTNEKQGGLGGWQIKGISLVGPW